MTESIGNGAEGSSWVGVNGVPDISVVVPAYNSARFLAMTLDSIQAQSERRWECLIIDDGSTDNTFKIAQRFAAADGRFKVWHMPNCGAAAARNAGFRHSDARSRYITFMDSDDIWLPHALATLRQRLEQDPDAVASHGLAEFVDANGAVREAGAYPARERHRLGIEDRRLVVWPLDRPTDFAVLINGNVLFPPGLILAHRSACEEVGPFDETLSGAEDWDMLIRLSRRGHLVFVDEVLLHYRMHDANLGSKVTVPEQAWRVRCIGFYAQENSPAHRCMARCGWRAYQKLQLQERSVSAVRALRARHLKATAFEIARVLACCLRYLRGYPLPRVQRQPLRW